VRARVYALAKAVRTHKRMAHNASPSIQKTPQFQPRTEYCMIAECYWVVTSVGGQRTGGFNEAFHDAMALVHFED